MNIRLTLIACILLLAVGGATARAEVRATAEVDRTTLAPGESVLLRVTLVESEGEVDLSDLSDFKVVSSSSGSKVQIINGKMTQEYTYNYVLIPVRRGRLSIPALTVVADGRKLATEPIFIEVKARDPKAADLADRELWVSAEISNAQPVQGEQITYTFRFFRRVNTDNARYQQPNFEGFTTREIEDQRTFRETIAGKIHMVTQLDYVLTPMAAGRHTIEPSMLQLSVVRPNDRRGRSPFEDFIRRRNLEQRVLQSEALDVQVRPLPPWQGRPAFSGLVGRFELSAAMDAIDMKVGDSATLAITLEGRGNLMDAQAPDLQLPPSLKYYADTPEEEIKLDRNGYSGRKVFRAALVPVTEGRIEIDPIQVVYYDTEENRYRTLSAVPPVLSVAPGDASAETAVAVAPNPLALAKQRVAFTGRDILPPKESLAAVRSRSPLPAWIFVTVLAIPALVYGGLVATQRFRRQEQTPTALMRAKARQSLKKAGSRSGGERLGHLYQALTAAILAAAGRTGEALTWKEAETMLRETGRTEEEARQAADLLSRIESGKFGAARLDDTAQGDLLEQTRRMIRRLGP